MLRLTLAVLAFALAGTASAAGWRKLQIDASSEATFKQSVATFQKKLSPSRRAAFAESLRDIEQEAKTRAEYLQQLHGLGYEEVVTLVDPTGKRARYYRAAYYQSRPRPSYSNQPSVPSSGDPRELNRSMDNSWRGGTDLVGVPGQK